MRSFKELFKLRYVVNNKCSSTMLMDLFEDSVLVGGGLASFSRCFGFNRQEPPTPTAHEVGYSYLTHAVLHGLVIPNTVQFKILPNGSLDGALGRHFSSSSN